MLRGLEELTLRRLPQRVIPAKSLPSTPIGGGNPLAVDGCRVKPGMTCRRGLRLWTMAFWRQLLEETPQDGLTSCQVRNITYQDVGVTVLQHVSSGCAVVKRLDGQAEVRVTCL